MIPIVTNKGDSIESRAKKLMKHLENNYKEHNQRVNLITYSAAGVDARAAVEFLGGDKYINSISTVAAPH